MVISFRFLCLCACPIVRTVIRLIILMNLIKIQRIQINRTNHSSDSGDTNLHFPLLKNIRVPISKSGTFFLKKNAESLEQAENKYIIFFSSLFFYNSR